MERVLFAALAQRHYPYNTSKREQMLLYIRGEGGVSKSQIIKVIVANMDLILYKNKVILIAPTGAATDNISGNTYYTLLGIGLFKI